MRRYEFKTKEELRTFQPKPDMLTIYKQNREHASSVWIAAVRDGELYFDGQCCYELELHDLTEADYPVVLLELTPDEYT